VPAFTEHLAAGRIGQARLIAWAIRLTSSDPARFPAEAVAVYRRNAARKGGLNSMLKLVPRGASRGQIETPR
jgi:hypothetical protein